MSKHVLEWDKEKMNRFIKEGRGTGEGSSYKPWLTIQDFPSIGRASRVFGWKTKRIHHFFTDIETRYFYLLEWSDNVTDIREHFPLLDLEDVIKDKDGINFEHFKDKKSGITYVINTSFLITLKDSKGNKSFAARSLKAASGLEKKSTLERLETERRYWSSKGIDWGIVTQKEISVVMAKNIEWIHSALFNENDIGITADEIKELDGAFMERINDNPKTMRTILMDFDKDYTLENGTALYIFKHLIADKKIKVDMNQEISLNKPSNQLIIKGYSTGREEYVAGS